MLTTQELYEREMRWTRMEMMWGEVVQVAGDEKMMGTGGRVSGRQVEGGKVVNKGPLVHLG
jgi:hypothetical protein